MTRRQKKVYTAILRVTLNGEGCDMCPALRYRMADERRYCTECPGTLENWKTERSPLCPLTNIEEKKMIMED